MTITSDSYHDNFFIALQQSFKRQIIYILRTRYSISNTSLTDEEIWEVYDKARKDTPANIKAALVSKIKGIDVLPLLKKEKGHAPKHYDACNNQQGQIIVNCRYLYGIPFTALSDKQVWDTWESGKVKYFSNNLNYGHQCIEETINDVFQELKNLHNIKDKE